MYDMAQMRKWKKLIQLSPKAMDGFQAFDSAVFAEGKLSVKAKELIAVAVALTTQCPYCIEIHTKRAKAAGNTEEEIAEAATVSAAIRAGSSLTHAMHCLE